MKKLMCVFAAAVMALGVQAAAVEWSSGVFNGPDGSSSKTGKAYSNVYSAVFSIYADAAGETLLASDTTSDVNKKGMMKGEATIADPAEGVTQTYYTKLVITDIASGKALESTMGSFTHTGGALTAPSLTFYGDDAGGFANNGAPSASPSGWSGGGGQGDGGAPEPTSGLLLLVGGALLGLRRKRA